MTALHRLLPPPGTHSPISANGRTYDPAAAAYVDAPAQDARILAANGWVHVGLVGATSARPLTGPATPSNPEPITAGAQFVDTTVGGVITFDGLAWRDISGSAV